MVARAKIEIRLREGLSLGVIAKEIIRDKSVVPERFFVMAEGMDILRTKRSREL